MTMMTLMTFCKKQVGQPHDAAIHNVTVENLRWFYDFNDNDGGPLTGRPVMIKIQLLEKCNFCCCCFPEKSECWLLIWSRASSSGGKAWGTWPEGSEGCILYSSLGWRTTPKNAFFVGLKALTRCCRAENTGDDSVAFFNVASGGVVRDSNIRFSSCKRSIFSSFSDSFARGIFLFNSPTTLLEVNFIDNQIVFTKCIKIDQNKVKKKLKRTLSCFTLLASLMVCLHPCNYLHLNQRFEHV